MASYVLYQSFSGDGTGDCSSYLVPLDAVSPRLLDAELRRR